MSIDDVRLKIFLFPGVAKKLFLAWPKGKGWKLVAAFSWPPRQTCGPWLSPTGGSTRSSRTFKPFSSSVCVVVSKWRIPWSSGWRGWVDHMPPSWEVFVGLGFLVCLKVSTLMRSFFGRGWSRTGAWKSSREVVSSSRNCSSPRVRAKLAYSDRMFRRGAFWKCVSKGRRCGERHR